MSATIANEYKSIRDAAEDELSTSAGSSDNEVVPGDDEPFAQSIGAVLKWHARSTQNILTTEMVNAVMTLYSFFSVVLCGAACQQLLQLSAGQPCALPAYVQPVTPKTTRSKTTKARNPAPTLATPPGLSVPACNRKADNRISLMREIGPGFRPPPGLDAPPGLEAFSCPPQGPPGLFDYCQPAAPASRRKQKQEAVTAKRAKAKAGKTAEQVTALPAVADPKVASRSSQKPAAAPAPLQPTSSPSTQSNRLAGVFADSLIPTTPREFEQATYRKELSDVLRDLANGTNVAACVRRIRAQNVPKERQAAEFADILTRAAEESRGSVRRLSFAFAVGLAAGEPNSAFAREECEQGLENFLGDVEELAAEVPRLRNKISNELVPTLRMVFSDEAQLARLCA